MLCWCWRWKWQGQQWQWFSRSDDKKNDNHDDKYDKYDNHGDKDDKGGRTYDEPLTLRPVHATRGNLSQSRRRRPPARLSLEMGRFLQLRIEFKLVIDIKDI